MLLILSLFVTIYGNIAFIPFPLTMLLIAVFLFYFFTDALFIQFTCELGETYGSCLLIVIAGK